MKKIILALLTITLFFVLLFSAQWQSDVFLALEFENNITNTGNGTTSFVNTGISYSSITKTVGSYSIGPFSGPLKVSCAAVSSYDTRTIDFRIYVPNDGIGNMNYLDFWISDAQTLSVHKQGGTLYLFENLLNTFISLPVTYDTWVNYSITFTGTYCKLYKDNIYIGQMLWAGGLGSRKVRLGGAGSLGLNAFTGYIDNFAMSTDLYTDFPLPYTVVSPTVTPTITVTVTLTSTPSPYPTKQFSSNRLGYNVVRLKAGNDTYGNTPNAFTHSFPEGVVELNNNIYVGGDFPFINKIDMTTWAVSRYLGKSDNRAQLTPGTRSTCRMPDGITDMKYDSNTNSLYMASYWYSQIWKYDMTTDYFNNFSGAIYTAGCVQGNSVTARYRYPGYCDVKGNTVYVSDRDTHLITGIYIPNQTSYIIAGVADTTGYTDGVGLTSTVRLGNIKGIAANSTNTLIYFSDPPYIRVIDVSGNSVYTLCEPGNLIAGLVITSDNAFLYGANSLTHKVMKIDIINKSYANFCGALGNNFTDAAINTGTVKFSGPTNLNISPDNKRLYVTETTNNMVKQINLDNYVCYKLHGLGAWSTSNLVNFTGWPTKLSGFDFFYNSLIVINNAASVISKITGNIKEDIAGQPGLQGNDNGLPNVSTLADTSTGCTSTYGPVPYFYFFNNVVVRKINLNTNTVESAFAGSGSGYVEGIGTAIKYGTQAMHMAAYDKYIYFSDSGNFCIRRYNIDTNTSELVAGIPGDAGTTNGVGLTTTCKFSRPQDIVFDKNSNGNIFYTIDYDNGNVYWVDIAGNSKGTTYSGPVNQRSLSYNHQEKEHYNYSWAGGLSTAYLNKAWPEPVTPVAGGRDQYYWIYSDGNAITNAVIGISDRNIYNSNQKYIMFDDLRYLDMSIPGSTVSRRYGRSEGF